MRNKLAALLLAVATGSAAAEGPQPLAVVVHGSIDAAALRAQIARELGTAVTAASNCPATCLQISVSDGRASVSYASATTAPATRPTSASSVSCG